MIKEDNKKTRVGALTVKDNQRLNSRGYMVTALINLFFLLIIFVNQPEDATMIIGVNSMKAGISIFFIVDAFSNLFNLKYASSSKLFWLLLLNAGIAFMTITLAMIAHFTNVVGLVFWLYFAAAAMSIIVRASILSYISKKVLLSELKDFKTDSITIVIYIVAVLCGVGLYFASVNYLAVIIVYIVTIVMIMASIAFIMWKNNAAFYLEPSWYLVFAVNIAIAMTLLHTLAIRFDVVMLGYSWIIGLSAAYADLFLGNYKPNWQDTETIFGMTNPYNFKQQLRDDDIDERAADIYPELMYWNDIDEDLEEVDELENVDNEYDIFDDVDNSLDNEDDN